MVFYFWWGKYLKISFQSEFDYMDQHGGRREQNNADALLPPEVDMVSPPSSK